MTSTKSSIVRPCTVAELVQNALVKEIVCKLVENSKSYTAASFFHFWLPSNSGMVFPSFLREYDCQNVYITDELFSLDAFNAQLDHQDHKVDQAAPAHRDLMEIRDRMEKSDMTESQERPDQWVSSYLQMRTILKEKV